MITRQDVQLTLEALDPATPATEVDALYTRIQAEKDQYREQAYMRMKTQHQKVKGTLPDWTTDVAIRDRAAMEAENTVRGLYLEPLTAQITETELELEEQEAELTQELAMQNPRAWADLEQRIELPEAPTEFQEAMEIWPTQNGGWLGIASKRLAQAEYHGLPRPYEQNEPLAVTWEAEIQEQYDAQEEWLKSV